MKLRRHHEAKPEEVRLDSPLGRFEYAQETLRLSTSLWAYIVLHPIKYHRGYREVRRRMAVLDKAMKEVNDG